MEIKNLVIHKLEKKQGGNAKLTKAKKVLKVTQLHTDFMDEVKNVYYKKSNPIYGVFDSEVNSYPYQTFLLEYLNSGDNFYDFTVKAVNHFEKIINEISQATGGYILFSHLVTTEEFMVVIMLNDKLSYMINENLDINTNVRLDTEKLDVANFTNCTRWNNNNDVYLSFTKGKKDVPNYFKKFIGCTDSTSAKEACDNLKRALTDYLIQSGLDKKQIEEVKASVFSYCESRMKVKDDIKLEVISGLVDSNDPEAFKEFAATEDYQISASFKGHNTLKSLKYYTYKSKDLTLVFDSKLLNETIVYNENKNQLLIKNVPQSLQVQLSRKAPSGDNNE